MSKSKLESKEQVQSPPRPQRSGSKQLAENLSKDELLRRLKRIARELSDAEQGEHLEDYHGTVTVLARTFIIKHADKDVRFYAACCFAHVLRIYAPEAPYDRNHLWSIFDLIISQLEGLKYAKSKGEKGTSYEKLFNLLETLALVKTLILCVQMEFTDLILKFFKIIFSSVRDEHSKKVKNFMLDIMSTLLSEAEYVPREFLDIMLENIVNPKKTSNRAAYELASALIERTATFIEPHVQQFFNNALFFDKASESRLEDSLYEVLYELYNVCPSILLSVLPQLEFKLKTVDKNERIPVVELLGKMFSDEESTLAQSHKPLWQCFLGRFVDIDTEVRVECIKRAKFFILHHPELVPEITEKLLQRQRDPEQKVRMEVVTAICEAASESINNVSQQLFDVVTERLRDRKFDIRKDTMMSLGRLYKKMLAADVNTNDKKKVSWIPTKILHCYYHNSPEDRIHVERVFIGCLVPISLTSKERMKRLFILYQTLDEPGVRAFNHMLKSQASLRSDMNDILRLWEEHHKTNSEEAKKRLTAKISATARVLPEPAKSQEHLKSFAKMLSEKNLLNLMKVCLGSGQDCSKVTEAVKEVVKFGGKNPIFETIKAILDRAAPLLIDTSSGKELVTLVTKCVNDEVLDDDVSSEEDSETFDRDEVGTNGRKALDLLLTCVTVFPTEFKSPLLFQQLLMYLKKGEPLVDYALRILIHIGQGLEEIDATSYSHFQPALTVIVAKGKPSQVKLAGRIITKTYPNSSSTIFKRILENRVKSLDYGSSSILATLSCISEIALHSPAVFEPHHATIIRDFVVKELLLKDRGKIAKSGALWCEEDELSKEVKAKIFGLKILVNWLRGKPVKDKIIVQPVFKMLDQAIALKGDITGKGRIRACEMSHVRLAAACGYLKLAQHPAYHEYLNINCFQNLISIIKDTCSQVREKIAKKLSKGLDSLKLPLEYLALFSFYGKEASKDIRQQAKQMILRNINIRNEYLRQRKTAPERSTSLLPEYAMPYLIYMLSHLPSYDYTKSNHLREIKEYLWFFMECILARGDNYNFTKKLAENIKHTKDANAEETDSTNHAIYVVCDIVIGIILGFSKTRTFLLKDYPAHIVLPKKLYAPLEKDKWNNKSYLPKGFFVSPVKKTTNIVSKITPTKSVSKTSSGSTGKKKTAEKPSPSNDSTGKKRTPPEKPSMSIDSTGKKRTPPEKPSMSIDSTGKRKAPAEKPSRISEKLKGKMIQKSLLSMMDNKDNERDNEKISDVEEDETPARKEKTKEKHGKPSEEDKEEKFTKVSPRKKTKTSTTGEKATRQNVRSSTKESTKSSPTKMPPTKKRQTTTEAVSSPKERRAKKSPTKVMKEETPTRFSPRRNQKSAVERNKRRTNLDEVKRVLEKEDYPDENSKTPMDKRAKDSLGEVAVNGTSQSTTDDSQTDTGVPSAAQNPVKKRKIVEENSHENPVKKSSLVIKRQRKRR